MQERHPKKTLTVLSDANLSDDDSVRLDSGFGDAGGRRSRLNYVLCVLHAALLTAAAAALTMCCIFTVFVCQFITQFINFRKYK